MSEPRSIKGMTFKEVMESAQKKADEFAKLPQEEQARRIAERDKILAKMGPMQGLIAIGVAPRPRKKGINLR